MIVLQKVAGILFFLMLGLNQAFSQGFEGYYQYPDIHQNTVVFAAEGNIWRVSVEGGLAQRLTTHAEEERFPLLSPDGKTLAYAASYEGPVEVYTLPVDGGLSTRWTFEPEMSVPTSWTRDGNLLYQTNAFSRLPVPQLVHIDLETKVRSVVPLHQASEGVQNEDGVYFFVTPANHGDTAKRYVGGWARQIWRFDGSNEAVKLTTDHPGEHFNPMLYGGRVYFITDRDGIKNIWSMTEDGGDVTQHTRHREFDVRHANADSGRIVYQHAADIWLLDIASGEYEKIDIRLASDLDQLRERWVENPAQYITSAHPDPGGEKMVVTARGRVFVFPAGSGRSVSFAEPENVRYRDAVFSHDGRDIIALSDESGEFEFVRFPADGTGETQRLTNDGEVLRRRGIPSPDGRWIAYADLENRMYVLNTETGQSQKVSTHQEGIRDFSWSPDSRWLAFVQFALNQMAQIKVYHVQDETTFDLTTDWANSFSPVWSPDGKFIYFLSDRSFTSLVGSPWGARQPEPYWDAQELIYHVALQRGIPSPFREKDELMHKATGNPSEASGGDLVVEIDTEGIQSRIAQVLVPAGNYSSLAVNDRALYFMARDTGINARSHLKVVRITNEDVATGVNGFELTRDGSKLLIRRGQNYFVVNAGTGSANLTDAHVDFSGWAFAINPREDWRQLYKDAWRMHRDYFYDPNMHGVDWEAMYHKYLPLVDRVTTRNELSDVLGELIGELSALHSSSGGGDIRRDESNIQVASLGARTSRDIAGGGFRIEHIYRVDPDYPHRKAPLDDPYLDIREGDIITKVNRRDALSAVDIGELIRNQAGKQVRLELKRGAELRDVIVTPSGNSFWQRYNDWQYSNRLKVEEAGENEIGYLHMSAMGSWDIGHFFREFYPVFNRRGLIIDMRYNGGGNIDSFLLSRLLREAWMYWISRSGEPSWNMQYAFRGHIVVLVNERTGSDGETLAEGFRRLGLGTTIGTRTWGGQIWLNSANRLSDNGIARAPMTGVYGPEGEWLIEGYGFVPDIEVRNLPHASFNGTDAQLDAAIKLLLEKIEQDPRDVPPVPEFPDKSFGNH